MNTTTLITTILYGLTAAYVMYMAIMNLFVYFANVHLGHEESFKMPMIYLLGGLTLCALTFLGYRIYTLPSIGLLFKILFYIPVLAIILYILWAILLVFSSGGKWN
jgi:hypothetical protein